MTSLTLEDDDAGPIKCHLRMSELKWGRSVNNQSNHDGNNHLNYYPTLAALTLSPDRIFVHQDPWIWSTTPWRNFHRNVSGPQSNNLWCRKLVWFWKRQRCAEDLETLNKMGHKRVDGKKLFIYTSFPARKLQPVHLFWQGDYCEPLQRDLLRLLKPLRLTRMLLDCVSVPRDAWRKRTAGGWMTMVVATSCSEFGLESKLNLHMY